MKLLIVSPYFFEPHRWMVSAYKMATYLSRFIEVVVVTAGTPAYEEINPKLRIYRSRDWFLPDPVNYSVVPGIFRVLRRVLRDEQPSVFVVNKHMFFTSLAAFYLKLRRKRVVLATDAFPGMDWLPRNALVAAVMRLYAWTVGLMVLRSAHLVVVFHEGLIERARRLRLRWRVIHNGVDFDQLRPSEYRRVVGLPEKAPEDVFVTYVGRLESIKGYDVLLEAAQRITGSRPNVHFVLVGNVEGKTTLVERYRSSRIHFLGHRTDVHEILRRTDVFVLPSFAEGLPNSLMEAMAVGLACVATAVGGVPSLISDRVHGLLVPPRNADALVQAILELVRDPALRTRLGLKAKERIATDYNWEHIAREYLSLFQSLSP